MDKKFEVAIHSLTISSSLTSSLWLIEAVGRPLYPGLAMLEKACGTTCGLCSNFSPATRYQLPLFGGLERNCPISKDVDEEGPGLTTVSRFWRSFAISFIRGSFRDGGREDCSMRNMFGSRPSPEPSL